MGKILTIIPEVAGVPVVARDASVAFITDTFSPIGFDESYEWTFVPIDNSSGGNPRYTLEASQDGVNWTDYSSVTINVTLGTPLVGRQLAWRHLRIDYDGGATGGDVTMKWEGKQK